jgi:hypothetical protein
MSPSSRGVRHLPPHKNLVAYGDDVSKSRAAARYQLAITNRYGGTISKAQAAEILGIKENPSLRSIISRHGLRFSKGSNGVISAEALARYIASCPKPRAKMISSLLGEEVDQRNLPRSRSEAIATGSFAYFTGKPCKNGHISTRKTSNGCCVACLTSGGENE